MNELAKDMEPKPNSRWRHVKTGAVYMVAVVTNQASTRPEYVPTVVYVSAADVWWSRPLADWHRSFVPAEH